MNEILVEQVWTYESAAELFKVSYKIELRLTLIRPDFRIAD